MFGPWSALVIVVLFGTGANPGRALTGRRVLWRSRAAANPRGAARAGSNRALDWENLAEEIESLGRSDRRKLRSQIYRIVRHLAKLQFSPARDSRRGWRDSIRDGRKQVQNVLADSPSLKPQL